MCFMAQASHLMLKRALPKAYLTRMTTQISRGHIFPPSASFASALPEGHHLSVLVWWAFEMTICQFSCQCSPWRNEAARIGNQHSKACNIQQPQQTQQTSPVGQLLPDQCRNLIKLSATISLSPTSSGGLEAHITLCAGYKGISGISNTTTGVCNWVSRLGKKLGLALSQVDLTIPLGSTRLIAGVPSNMPFAAGNIAFACCDWSPGTRGLSGAMQSPSLLSPPLPLSFTPRTPRPEPEVLLLVAAHHVDQGRQRQGHPAAFLPGVHAPRSLVAYASGQGPREPAKGNQNPKTTPSAHGWNSLSL